MPRPEHAQLLLLISASSSFRGLFDIINHVAAHQMMPNEGLQIIDRMIPNEGIQNIVSNRPDSGLAA